MVGLRDIPCVGKFVERVSEYTVDAVFRSFKYLFCYKALVNDLNSEIENLNIEKDKISRRVKQEEKNGKIIEDYVSKWQEEVEEIQKSAEELSPSCSCIQPLPIPNPISRFRIGRNAVKKAEIVAKLNFFGKEHLTGEIAYRPEVKYMPNSDSTFEEFESRKDVYNKLWHALVDEDSPLIHGIYGMAGVGKTRMMEQFCEDSMKKNIFNKAVRVNVGNENTDKIKLQDQIAGRLECKLETEFVESRASQLENSLKNGGKILLILDDVWTKIPLKDIVGAPFGDGSSSSKGSKILLTSRKKEVCLNNECEHVVEIETLSRDEALSLFEKTVGLDSINSLPDQSLVEKVCDKCGRLPLVIHAVGKALKGKPHDLWKDAHNQLMEGNFENIPDVDPQVYTSIKLSIDYLRNDDAKSCLFLCSMFPEDANINMKMLIQLATGSGLILDGESRVLAMVAYLKISSLLLNSGGTKVHDIIRSVARSVAFTDSKYAFLQVTCNSGYLPSNANYRSRKFLRLDVKTADVHFHEHLVCPDLHTLWVQSDDHPQQFSGGFFRMFANLSCLMLQNVKITLEHFSLHPLGNLGTLTLVKCDIRKTDARLFPKSLESLCIYGCDLPKPLGVANLKCLRKLEINHWRPVLVMENVISSLSGLEELHISNGFIHDYDEYHLEPILMEISELTHLRSLHFEFYEDNSFQGTDIFSNINRYNIFVGRRLDKNFLISRPDWEAPLKRSIEFLGKHSKPWEGLMARAEEVELSDSDVVVSSICNGYRRAFEGLKRLHIYKCDNMGHLASISGDEIQYSVQSPTCFSKLTSLEISWCSKLEYLFCNNIAKGLVQLQELNLRECESMEAIIMIEDGTSDGDIIRFSKLTILNINNCSKLKYLFCNNIAKGLVQLQELNVRHCESMEAIIMNEDGTSDRDIISFSKLKSLYIRNTPRLRSFCAENSGYPSAQYQPVFDGMVAFPSLKILGIEQLPNTRDIWGKEYYNDSVSSFGQLNHLYVWGCENLETVIPHGMLHRLHNLEFIYLLGCSSLRTIFQPSVATGLKHLKELIVSDCKETREIVEAGEQMITHAIPFPELTNLRLHCLPKLKSFWCYPSGIANTCKVSVTLPRLSKVSLERLPDLRSFFHGANFEFHLPALKNVEVDTCGFSALFMFSTFRSFQLEYLKVYDCELLENIVDDLRDDETCDNIITLTQLKEVVLGYLPKLKSFFHNANYEFHTPVMKKVKVVNCGFSNALFTHYIFQNLKQLEELIIRDCELLEGIFEDANIGETLDTSGKIITLNRVSTVDLEGLPKLKSIFYGTTYKCYMPVLKNVKITGCGLSNLFTCSMFHDFQQLEELHISNCESLEQIVEEVEGDETSKLNGKSIKSSKLSSITLESLSNLKSFSCSSSYVFNMPKLQNFMLIECPQIEYFSSSKTNTPLVLVTSDWCSEEEFQDLNDFVRQNHKRESYLNDRAGESTYSSQHLGTQSERIEEEKPQEGETDQPGTSV